VRRIAALALAATTAACAPPAPSRAPPPAQDPTFQATLERGMCLGPCPVYQVVIDASGLVTFTGSNSNIDPDVPCQGRRQWRIAPAAVTRLEALIDRAGFFGFKPAYVAGITDQASYAVTVTRRGRTGHVQDYVGQMAGMPGVMSEIEDAIDIAAGDKDCVVAKTTAASAPTRKATSGRSLSALTSRRAP
jgi:Domain of unknown function (DUF6438)